MGNVNDSRDGLDPITREQVRSAYEVLQTIGAGPEGHLTIIGGMVPTLRSRECTKEIDRHIGTSDLDLAVRLVMTLGATEAYYRGLTKALRALGLQPQSELSDGGKPWRWVSPTADDKRQVELLTDLTRNAKAAQVAEFQNWSERDGDQLVAPLQMPHCELTFKDREVVTIPLTTANGFQPEAEFPVAGLGSWLVMKVAAARSRGDEPPLDYESTPGKDYYDIVWMLTCLGPAHAARVLCESPLLDGGEAEETLRESLRRLRGQFQQSDAIGPQRAAELLRPEDENAQAMAARDAVESVTRTLDFFDECAGGN